MIRTLLLATLPQAVLACAFFCVLAPTSLRTARRGVAAWRAEGQPPGDLSTPLLPASSLNADATEAVALQPEPDEEATAEEAAGDACHAMGRRQNERKKKKNALKCLC